MEIGLSPTLPRKNLATWERVVRLAIGGFMLVAAAADWVDPLGKVTLLLFAWVPILTSALGWDPIYALLRIGPPRE